jgi:hypothetical protein
MAVTDREWLTPAVWTPQRTVAVANRFINRFQQTPPHLRQTGAEFYPTWHEDAQHIGHVTGLGHEAGAAILAHLSPANEAEQNRIQALQLVHGVSDRQAGHLINAAKSSRAAQSAEVRLRHAEPGSRFHQELTSELAGHTARNAALRRKAGIEGTPLGNLGSREIGQALEVRQGQHAADPLASLGRMKRRDFGGMIADPIGATRAPIDTHYHDIGVGQMNIPWTTKRGLEGVKRYEAFQGAHLTALNKIRQITGEEIPSSEFMAASWYGHLQAKMEANPHALRSRRAANTRIARARAAPAAQPYLPERFGLRPAFGKLDVD